jgi:hypothetical protein
MTIESLAGERRSGQAIRDGFDFFAAPADRQDDPAISGNPWMLDWPP